MTNVLVFFLVNLAGGIIVLGSYVVGLYLYPDFRNALWGGVTGSWKTIFTVSMFFAAAGYLVFCYSMTVSDGADKSLILGRHTFSILAAFFLISASVWMPATLKYLASDNNLWWTLSVISLWITAASLILLTVFFGFSKYEGIGTIQFSLTLAGIIWITIHCLVFDAIIWVAKFH
ncbi:hypothetical protein OAJ44_01745 [Chloroflexi bacterium]|nr:hypothetical protein [Chloroflexota bacterium]